MARGLRLYKSYSFRDKDPVVDVIRTVVKDSGLGYAEVEAKSGVSASTVYNWFHGKTRRPQFATVEAVARSCGSTFKCVRRT